MSTETSERNSLDNRPGILIIGSPNVGKRTMLTRLISEDFEDASDSSSQVLVRGWTINTKYYTADVSLWMAHLEDGFSVSNLPSFNQLTAVVMVFDMSELSTLTALKEWVSHSDIQNFEISLCVGNKVDLLPNHPVHAEYKRHLLKREEASADRFSEFADYGISETEGSSLLGYEEPSLEVRRSCLEWCCEHNIEFIEACASSADFDKCLSVNGDSQGLERIFGALAAYMWPGMILKSGYKITRPSLPESEELSEEEADFEFDYEVLSAGSADPWDETETGWVSAHATNTISDAATSSGQLNSVTESNQGNTTRHVAEELHPPASNTGVEENNDKSAAAKEEEADNDSESEKGGAPCNLEDLEQLMSEIGNMRDNLRLMPDFQRREMAANLAMKMAAMFGGESDEERI